MIIITFNCRGLASIPKKLPICRLIVDQSIDVLFLHEMMGNGVLFSGELENMLNGWSFVFVDAKGRLGGLLLGWKSQFFQLHNS